ncbi:MAG TPA: SO2930 family diheme c-type cytochrome [Burkholderiaceae bacterium]
MRRRLLTATAAGLLALLASCARAPAPVVFIADGRPEHLSDWHLLNVSGGRLTPNAGVLPYDLVTPLFSDYAHKLRTVWMPQGVSAKYSPDQAFDFPVGTVLSKTFYYPRAGTADAVLKTYDAEPGAPAAGLDLSRVHLVETRVLVRRAEGWTVLPYVWNAAQTEADLQRTGDTQTLELVDAQGHGEKFAYVVPNENQCASCHVTNLRGGTFTPLGPKARNLNRTLAYADGSENQIARWVRAGFLTGVPAVELPRAADWRDVQQPIAARARSYLDVNCAHCHQNAGTASNTSLRLDALGPADWSLGICKPSVAAGKGTGDRIDDIVPGKPDESILPFRLASTEGGVMMPELGRNTVHQEGVQLIRDWIASMPPGCKTDNPTKD